MKRPHKVMVAPTDMERKLLADYARDLMVLDLDQFIETGKLAQWHHMGGSCDGRGWFEWNRQHLSYWRNSADDESPELAAMREWMHAGGIQARVKIPSQTWCFLTWPAVWKELRPVAQLDLFEEAA